MRFRVGICLVAAAIALSPAAAWSQVGWNIDLDDEFAPPEGGGGLPSSNFGAAAGDEGRGYWNYLDTTGDPPTQLRGLDGELTPVVVTGPTSGSGGGWRNEFTSGDIALLLNDGRSVSTDTWTFTGLSPGRYRVLTYAIWPNETLLRTSITVPGALFDETQIVGGSMPRNDFLLGTTHSEHFVDVSDGGLSITADAFDRRGFVNGFQVIAVVPEPATLVASLIGLAAVLGRRRRRN